MQMSKQHPIKAFRSEKRWSRERLAQRLSVSVYTVANWEQGRTRLHQINLANLAKLMRRDVDDMADILDNWSAA